MPRTRFFINKLPDYNKDNEQQASVSGLNWSEQIESIIHTILEAFPKISTSDGGLYVGNAGIAYMLCRASTFQPLAKRRDSYLSKAKSIYDKDLKFSVQVKPKDSVSFLLGPAGVYVMGALLGKTANDPKLIEDNINRFQSLAKISIEPHFLSCGSDELFVGRAGYLCGALNLQKELERKVLSDEIVNAICTVMVKSGRDYAKHHRSQAPLMYAYYDTEYLGAAHGLSSILQILISCSSFLQADPQAANEIKHTIDWMLSLQQENGNFAPATDELRMPRPESQELVHWCHGAPGVVYLFAKAYQVWGDERYLQACLRCGELTWRLGLLKKGPGICHGIAGSGYVFLLLYRLTGDKKHLHRAQEFANFLFTDEFQSGARTPDCPYSLYEGWAGTVCFLLDLQQPEKAEFPFFDIF